MHGETVKKSVYSHLFFNSYDLISSGYDVRCAY